MGSRDHAEECQKCGGYKGGINELGCDCDYPDVGYSELFCLARCLESAAYLAVVHRLGYTKGFSDGATLREFCEDYTPHPYFPLADNRRRSHHGAG